MPVVAPGYPFCYLHVKNGSMVTHDRYSNAMPVDLDTAHQHQLLDTNPKDLTQEIANLRALLRTFYNKKKDDSAPLDGDMIMTALQITDVIGRQVERQAKINPDRVITVPQAMAIVSKILDSINARLPVDQMAIREAIVRDIRDAIAEMLEGSTDLVPGANNG